VTSKVTAIETVWRGYRFRSRLEARWAVFFDTLGLPWEYEPEGFELGDGLRYLPDFRVQYPGRGADEVHWEWFEVKSDLRHISQDEWAKLVAFGDVTVLDGAPDLRMYGQPWDLLETVGGVHEAPYVLPYTVRPEQLERERNGLLLWMGKGRQWWDHHSTCFDCDWDHTKLRAAVNAARSARFEFAEGARVASV